MKEIILVRYGEIILKGLNRPVFEEKLIKNIKNAVQSYGKAKVLRSQARIYIEPEEAEYDIDAVMKRLTAVFGIVSVSRVLKIDSKMDEIREIAVKLAEKEFKEAGKKTFKVEARRGNKKFELNSLEINEDVGGYILEKIDGLKVDVHNPEFTVYIEVRESTYIYTEKIAASKGMPMGTNGKAVLLISGGIDSPVAGWMIAKRGVEIEAVHFFSYPYTGERAKEKVIELCRLLAGYCGKFRLNIVHFTDIQLAIYENCPDEQITLIMRRVMMKIAERVAEKAGASALITGESLGQVASQTIGALHVTNEVVKMPVFRPLIGMDKDEIIELARKIGTFKTSILPYEDCCTVFVPKHPETKPKLEKILESEKRVDLDTLIEKAIENIEVIEIS